MQPKHRVGRLIQYTGSNSDGELQKEVAAMLMLKACPKCKGDLQLVGDIYGSYASCLNCGFLLDVPEDEKVEVALRQRAQKRAA